MRVQLAIFVVVLAIYLGVVLQGAEANIPFSTRDATCSTYASFINALRAHLTNGVPTVSDIPVLPLNTSVPDSRRFVLVDLSNNVGNTITMAIDVVNVYVVAFRVRDQAYFFRDIPEAAFRTLFTETINPQSLNYSGNYLDLERRSQPRERTVLGLLSLHHAISMLWSDDSPAAVASSFLVIIQMVSEAVRFRFIETRIQESITNVFTFQPNPATLSLENGWSSLSTAIQSSLDGVVFNPPVTLRSISNNVVIVDNILSPVIAGLALLLHRCPGSGPT